MRPVDCTACRLGTLAVNCPVSDRDGRPCSICNGTGKRLHRQLVCQTEGTVPNDILLLGEAPGMMEDRVGLPFRPDAPAGRVLRKALAELGMSPALDNVTGCHPPDNKLKNYPDAIVTCILRWLPTTLEIVQPKVIVTMGALAGGSWFPGMKAMEMQQTARAVVMDDVRYIFVGALHPAYVARGTDPGAYGMMMASLQRAAQLVKEV